MTFKDASSQFEAGSIDLLHIDGAHRYEDVKEDFEMLALPSTARIEQPQIPRYRSWAELPHERSH
jgi:hypothetical protein